MSEITPLADRLAQPFLPDGVKALSIGEVTRMIKGVLEETFQGLWITGEICNLSRPASGHLYLGLKDSEAQISAVIWRATAQRLRFDLKEGLEVFVRGRVNVYAPRGQYQFTVEEIHPKGIGAAELALRQLKEKLLKLGYFTPERKRPLPRFPKRVALVTSPRGAAVRDMLEILTRRWPGIEIWVCAVRVQGDGAAEEVAKALTRCSRVGGIDVVIVGRGGGSAEDLSAFNAEIVAQAIFASRVPVVSAVGHEIDLTIADLVADCRALTPSEAAERVVPDRLEVLKALETQEGRLRSLLWKRLELAQHRLAQLADQRCFRVPLERVRDAEQKLDDLEERLRRGMRQRLNGLRERLVGQVGRLESLSPLNVLARGYSLTRKETDRTVVRQASQVAPGERIVSHLGQGMIVSRVESVDADSDVS